MACGSRVTGLAAAAVVELAYAQEPDLDTVLLKTLR